LFFFERIPEGWKSDSPTGRQNVIKSIVAEALKALIDADVPVGEFLAYAKELVDQASDLTRNDFSQKIFSSELTSTRSLILMTSGFPRLLKPTQPFAQVDEGDGLDYTELRRRLLPSFMWEDSKSFTVIVNKKG